LEKIGKKIKAANSIKMQKKIGKFAKLFETTKLIFYKNTGHEPRLRHICGVFLQSPGSYMRYRSS
jgi:hypothetical protein